MGRGDTRESLLPACHRGQCHDGDQGRTRLEAASEGDGEEGEASGAIVTAVDVWEFYRDVCDV